ncbi:MAG: spermidine/putrescine ABC transporter substrate-binding protein [Anaerolineales bacterium]|nr:spermidine/putrescine ABC transporter substrate-binding protein [Anaerolineales bacterium]
MRIHKLSLCMTIMLVISVLLAACTSPTSAPEPAAPEATEAAPEPTEAAPEPTEAAPVQTEEPAAPAIEPATEIVIFNWSEYIDPEIYAMFEEEFGIKVVEDNFSNNEELLAKLQGGATGYALIVPSDYTVGIMIEENMLAELDHANIPNLANLGQRFKELPYDPGNKYCAGYQWGTTGIGYLDGAVEAPTSWSVIFEPDPELPAYGRTTMLDDVRESFAAALVYLGYDINTTDEAQLEQAKELLIQAKAGLAGYDSDTFEDLLASEENLMAHGWNGDFLVAQESNENIAYVVPEEGGVVWVDNICIPISATPQEKLAGEMFIDFLLRPDIGAMLSEFNWYASPNAAAEELFDEEFLNDPTVYPPDEVLDRLQYIRPVGEAESIYQRLWDEIKAAQ